MSKFKLRTKSVSSAIEPSLDGLRILTTRYRGRGNESVSEVFTASYLAEKRAEWRIHPAK